VFKLRYDAAIEAVWDSLPDEAREELNQAIPEICRGPYVRSMERRGDKHRRVLTLRHTVIGLLVMDAPPIRRVYIKSIDHLG
jgi:hypothetical protein